MGINVHWHFKDADGNKRTVADSVDIARCEDLPAYLEANQFGIIRRIKEGSSLVPVYPIFATIEDYPVAV